MNPVFNQSLPLLHFETYAEEPQGVLKLQQYHSNIITTDTNSLKADGVELYMSDLNSITPSIKTADCLPIVLYNDKKVAFLHAGWRGIHSKIIQEINFIPSFAFIGPHISKDSFEVTEEFKQNFPNSTSFISIEGKLHFNLQEEAIRQIKELNSECQIATSNICTFKDHKFHSYRRNKTEKRNWHIIKRI